MLFKNKKIEEAPLVVRWFGVTLGAVILFILEVGQVLIIAAAIILPIRAFLVKPFVVRGASMEPNFFDSEYLIIDELTYRFRDAERGETVIFVPPTNREQFYIKRIIGLPGERVKVEDGRITIYADAEAKEGVVLEETYINEETLGADELILRMDEYYVIGDNRDHSLDSRRFGAVNESDIVGRAWLRGLPLEKIGSIKVPEYNF